MLDLKDKTPYEILDVSETAFAPVIERQLRHKLSLYCALDRDAIDINGDNLREIFEQAAKTLIDPNLRKQLDERLHKERLLEKILTKLLPKTKQIQSEETQPKYIILKQDGIIYSSNERSIITEEITIPTSRLNIQSIDLQNLINQLNILIINNPTVLNELFNEEGFVLNKK